MPRARSSKERVKEIFLTADETDCRVLLEMAALIVEMRFTKPAPAKKSGRPTGSKNRAQPPAPPLFEAAG